MTKGDWNSEVYCAGLEERVKAQQDRIRILEAEKKDEQKEHSHFGWAVAAAVLGGTLVYLMQHFVLKG